MTKFYFRELPTSEKPQITERIGFYEEDQPQGEMCHNCGTKYPPGCEGQFTDDNSCLMRQDEQQERTMTEDGYTDFVMSRVKQGVDILLDISPAQMHLLHMAVGVSGEAGELLDAIKKMGVYQKELDVQNVIEELGDIEFYMAGLRAELGISRGQCLQANMEKLTRRYPDGYSDAHAAARADKQEPEAVPIFILARTEMEAQVAFLRFEAKGKQPLKFVFVSSANTISGEVEPTVYVAPGASERKDYMQIFDTVLCVNGALEALP